MKTINGTSIEIPKKYPRLWHFFYFCALESLITVIYLFCMPADPKNSIFLGYSARRLAVISSVLMLMAISSVMAEKAKSKPERIEQFLDHIISQDRIYQTWLIAGGLILTACWALSWSPPYRFRPYDLLFKGLLPVIVLLTLLLGQTYIMMLIRKFNLRFSILIHHWCNQRREILFSGSFLAIILILWLMIALTGLGLIPDTVYWNSVGVPIQNLQVTFSLLVGLLLTFTLKNQLRQSHSSHSKNKVSQWYKNIDLWIFITIFIFTAILWAVEPQEKSFFAPAPRPPNDEWYPVSDAAGYDIAAQFALIGEGLNNREHVDKPLYSTFLILIHVIAGQRMENVVNAQAIFLALIPALIFLIGLLIHSRMSGIMAALLASFKGRNAIASAWMVLSANPKLLISEYLMALAIVILALFLVLWLRNPKRNYLFGLAVGGIMGLSTLIRHNAWILPAFIILITWIAFGRKWLRSLAWSLVLTSMLLTSIAAWSWRTYIVTGEPWYFLGPLHGVIIEQRFLPELETQETDETENGQANLPSSTQESITDEQLARLSPPIPTPSPDDQTHVQASPQPLIDGVYDDHNQNIIYTGNWRAQPYPDHYQTTAHISCNVGNSATFTFTGDQLTLVFPTHPNRGIMRIELNGALIKNLSQKTNRYRTQERWSISQLPPGVHTIELTHVESPCIFLDAVIIGKPPPPENTRFPVGEQLSGLFQAISAQTPPHFFHNIVTTVLMLSTQLRNDDLETLTLSPGTVWQADWQGELGSGALILLIINLILIAIGLGYSYGKHNLSGIAPIAIYIAYSLGIALARTSGGRYIVPIDWIMPLYFAIGLSQFAFWITTLFGQHKEEMLTSHNTASFQDPEKENSYHRHRWWRNSCLAVVGLLIIGSTPLISEHAFPKRYPDLSKQEVLQILEQRQAIEKMGYTQQQVEEFIQEEHSVLRIGRALYPRFYHANTGEPAKGAYRYMDYQRLVVTFINPEGGFNGILPIDTFPNYLPNTADIVLLGCDNSDANLLALVVLNNEDTIYVRSPKTDLACPLPDPICDGNGNCR